jgi:Na+/H+ antiporter NhaD/arsenite permease-like protein
MSYLNIFATVCFALAILHTFLVSRFTRLAARFKPGSVLENTFHLLGEIEVVFGLWAGLFLIGLASLRGVSESVHYLNERHFTEPVFVFVIMVVCASRPILSCVEQALERIAKWLPFNAGISFYLTTLIVAPLLGSFITEPAAMTVTALILFDRLYSKNISKKLKYATLGLLFVNISIGGTLTAFAAPPVLMVAAKWGWTSSFMLTHFGWKAVVSIIIGTVLTVILFKKELSAMDVTAVSEKIKIPIWVTLVHLGMLLLIVLGAHYMAVFVLLFLFFIGFTAVTEGYQSKLKFKEGLLVGFFLGGLVILGGPQKWWLEPILTQLNAITMFLGAIGLTSFTDNAALTYLGSQVPHLSDSIKYALVAGSVTGGGLTAIANAPNPVGYGILKPAFGEEGISPLHLALAALPQTVLAAICFWFL